jgi:hypothetical protein
MRLLRGPNIERRGWLLVCDGLHLVHECLLVAVPFLGRRRQLIKGQKALRKDLFLRSCTQTTPGLCYQCPRSDRVFCWVHLQVRARGSLGERTMAILPEPAVPRPSFACTCEVEMSMEHSYPSVWHQSAPISTNQHQSAVSASHAKCLVRANPRRMRSKSAIGESNAGRTSNSICVRVLRSC